jgi:3-oxoacyl-[acyl-carrier-protein] synthase-3
MVTALARQWSARRTNGFVSCSIKADGSYHKHWGIYSGGTYEPATVESVEAGRTKVKLVTPFPPTVNLEGWPARARECAANAVSGLRTSTSSFLPR